MKETQRDRESSEVVCLFSVKERERERVCVCACWRVCNVLRMCVYVMLSTN